MSVSKRKPIDDFVEEIDYPESDDEPMAETDPHIQQIIDLRSSLRDFFRNARQVYVGSNLLLYYVEGDPSKSVAPDVFVVRGVGKQSRRTYKLWEEKRAPNVVIEVSSRKTKNEDLGWKKQLYAWLDVREYFIPTPDENADARRQAEAEIERLRAELARLKKEPANGKRRKS